MKTAFSVNEAIDALPGLAGEDISVEGILRFEFEGTAIDHFPKQEQRAFQVLGPIEPSSIWLSVGTGALQFNEEQLRRWHGKRVTVHGTQYGPHPDLGRCGHLSGWPVEPVEVTLMVV